MWRVLFWSYFINAILLTCHEIDAAYWREWNLFASLFDAKSAQNDVEGLTGFLLFHIPVLALLQIGLLEVHKKSRVGLVFSTGLGVSGVLTFVTHMYFMSRGRPEFQVPISLAILIGLLVTSLVQVICCVKAYLQRSEVN